MFGNSSKKNASASVTLIAKNTLISGKVNFAGFLNIEGQIKGDIAADDASKSEVVVLEHGRVDGQIQAPRVIVNGHVVGDIFASDQLYIAAKAVVEGSVHYRLIEMEKGAQISGNLVHRSGPGKESKTSAAQPSRLADALENSTAKTIANT